MKRNSIWRIRRPANTCAENVSDSDPLSASKFCGIYQIVNSETSYEFNYIEYGYICYLSRLKEVFGRTQMLVENAKQTNLLI